MQGKVHVYIGVGALALFCVRYPTGFDFAGAKVLPEIGLVTAAFGSLLPDIDMQTTSMGHKHKITSKVVNKVGGGHRGFTHTLVIPALLAVTIWLVGQKMTATLLATILMSLLFGVEFGYLMHIFADMFNGKGCPILWPLIQSKLHFLDLPSSGIVPFIFGTFLLLIFGFSLFNQEILTIFNR